MLCLVCKISSSDDLPDEASRSSLLLNHLELLPSTQEYRVFGKTDAYDFDHARLHPFFYLSAVFEEKIHSVQEKDFPTAAAPFSFYL